MIKFCTTWDEAAAAEDSYVEGDICFLIIKDVHAGMIHIYCHAQEEWLLWEQGHAVKEYL